MNTTRPPARTIGNQNPAGLSLAALLAEDWRTHDSSFLEPGFWALAVHRFGNWRMDKPKPVRAPLTALYMTLHAGMILGLGIDLGFSVKVGRRVRIWHHGGMVLGALAIGDDVHIRQNTTLGVLDREHLHEKPIIGDRVELGAGACVLGGVVVGDDAVVGPASVVLRDVPRGISVLGVPARPVSFAAAAGAGAAPPGRAVPRYPPPPEGAAAAPAAASSAAPPSSPHEDATPTD